MSNQLVSINTKNVERAWENYLQTNTVNSEVVSKLVTNSWDRCRLLKVDPFINNTVGVFGIELSEKIKKREHLIKIARPFMQNLYNFVKGSGFEVVLSDEQGILLEVLGDQDVLEATKKILLCPGGDWSEKAKGTNAIGTAIIERQPLQIFATEHFCQPNHFLTCSAAPIYDPDGQLIGVLDVSGDYKKANPHTLGMVVAAVYAIESQLRLHRATNKLYMAYKYSNTIMESMSEGLVSVDKQGNITQLNTIGSKILGLDPKTSLGQNIESLLCSSLPIKDVITTGKGFSDREVLIEHNKGRRHFTSTVTPLIDEQGHIIGATATLREMEAVQKLISKMAGTQARYTFSDIIGEDTLMKTTIEQAKLAAESVSTILLQGESGTGKELFAQAIHNASWRTSGPFIAINCAALPRDLIESELFGYEEGAFTGAQKGGRPGKFELANGGTIFLDEIGDMPLETQVKLLRVLQEKQVTRVGGHRAIPIDIRVIAATHRNLHELIRHENFRLDLYYRLNVVNLIIPSLRDRGEDLSTLTKFLINKIANRLGKEIINISENFFAIITNYSWPGNVRELENALERTINLSKDGNLSEEHLPTQVKTHPAVDTLPSTELVHEDNTEIIPLWLAEKKSIEQALKRFDGNISQVAKALGIGRNTLYRKIKEYQL